MQVCPPTGAFRMVKSSDVSFFNYIWVNCYIIAKINEPVLRCLWYWKSTKSGWSRRRRCLLSVTGACERGEYPRWGAHEHRTLEGCPSNEQQQMSGVGALFQSATTLWYQSGGIRYAQTTRLPSGDAFSVLPSRVSRCSIPNTVQNSLTYFYNFEHPT